MVVHNSLQNLIYAMSTYIQMCLCTRDLTEKVINIFADLSSKQLMLSV